MVKESPTKNRLSTTTPRATQHHQLSSIILFNAFHHCFFLSRLYHHHPNTPKVGIIYSTGIRGPKSHHRGVCKRETPTHSTLEGGAIFLVTKISNRHHCQTTGSHRYIKSFVFPALKKAHAVIFNSFISPCARHDCTYTRVVVYSPRSTPSCYRPSSFRSQNLGELGRNGSRSKVTMRYTLRPRATESFMFYDRAFVQQKTKGGTTTKITITGHISRVPTEG